MKFTEIIFILLVIVVLFGLTAIRYRKQIAGIIGFARLLKEAKDGAIQTSSRVREPARAGVQLVHCAKCGVWVPEDKAMKLRDGNTYCSGCMQPSI